MKLWILCLLFCGAMAHNREGESWDQSDLDKEGCVPTLSERSLVFHSTPQTWAKAQTHCVSTGGHLAVISSKEEEDEIKALAGGQLTWIGLFHSPHGRTVLWLSVNSEPLSYTNWCPGEPNNGDIYPKCAVINDTHLKCWDDQRCASLRPYVCEKN